MDLKEKSFIYSVKNEMTKNPFKNISPVSGYKIGVVKIMQPFPTYLDGTKHTGVDFYCRQGMDYVSVTKGIVTEYANVPSTGINTLVIKCDLSGLYICYKHAKSNLEKGDIVDIGDVIAEPDDSGKEKGFWQGMHEHFQIWGEGDNIDPIPYLLEYQPDLIFEFGSKKVLDYYSKKEYFGKLQKAG